MDILPRSDTLFRHLGITSVTLGLLGLLFSFLPILGIPISAVGILAGLLGTLFSQTWSARGLRLSLGGIALSAVALALNIAIAVSPVWLFHSPGIPGPGR
jgi:hypothetical protein